MASKVEAGKKVTMEQLNAILSAPHLREQRVGGLVVRGNKIYATCNKGYGVNPPFPDDGKLCGGCKQVYYCNRKCQRADWGEHKHKCVAFADMA